MYTHARFGFRKVDPKSTRATDGLVSALRETARDSPIDGEFAVGYQTEPDENVSKKLRYTIVHKSVLDSTAVVV